MSDIAENEILPRLRGPWVESPIFELLLEQKALTPAEKELCRSYHRDGYLILDECLVDQADVDAIDAHVARHFDAKEGRLLDGWMACEAIRKLAMHDRVLELLRMLYDREPVPFQTLNFLNGTEQRTHSDFIHFSSLPARFMCGVWVALEDVTLRQGPLHYYPGSQRLPELDYYDLGISCEDVAPERPYEGELAWSNPRTVVQYLAYEKRIEVLTAAQGLERTELELRRGQFLIWASNLLHGGSQIRERGTSRRSQVSHYFFEDTVPITPMFSNAKSGEYFVRSPLNIRTRAPMKRTYDSKLVRLVPSAVAGRERVEVVTDESTLHLDADEERARQYLERYPDIAASPFGQTLAGARMHYELYGQYEGRKY